MFCFVFLSHNTLSEHVFNFTGLFICVMTSGFVLFGLSVFANLCLSVSICVSSFSLFLPPFVLSCLLCLVSFYLIVFIFRCQFSVREREQERVWIWMGGEVGKI